jgi:ligand-binding sensor domain-containing protein
MQDKAGKLWFVTVDGVYVYDDKSYTLFIINEAANSFLGSNDKAERILEDREGNIWFGGRTNEGVYRYDGKHLINIKLKELITLRFDSKQVTHSWAWPQLQDKNGNIWFSNWAGVHRYDGKTFTSFTSADGIPGDNGLVAKIIEDKKGNIWFGGAGGLSRFDGKSFTSFKDGLINPWIWTILEDRTGGIWVGTRDSGLYFFDGKIFINYSENKQGSTAN